MFVGVYVFVYEQLARPMSVSPIIEGSSAKPKQNTTTEDSEAVLGVRLPAPLPTSRRRLIGTRFGRWRQTHLGGLDF